MITKELNLYLTRDTERAYIRAVQDDSGNEICIHLKDVTLPVGATANAFVLKPSGLAVYNSAVVSDNDITFTLSTQMLAEVGLSRCQVHISYGGETVTTFWFNIYVEELLGLDAVESETTSSLFDVAVERGVQTIESATVTGEATLQAYQTAVAQQVATATTKASEASASADRAEAAAETATAASGVNLYSIAASPDTNGLALYYIEE